MDFRGFFLDSKHYNMKVNCPKIRVRVKLCGEFKSWSCSFSVQTTISNWQLENSTFLSDSLGLFWGGCVNYGTLFGFHRQQQRVIHLLQLRLCLWLGFLSIATAAEAQGYGKTGYTAVVQTDGPWRKPLAPLLSYFSTSLLFQYILMLSSELYT